MPGSGLSELLPACMQCCMPDIRPNDDCSHRSQHQQSSVWLTGLALAGDIFLAAACISYVGPFTGVYRDRLVQAWQQQCQQLGVPVSQPFSLQDTLASPMSIRDWTLQVISQAVNLSLGVCTPLCMPIRSALVNFSKKPMNLKPLFQKSLLVQTVL